MSPTATAEPQQTSLVDLGVLEALPTAALPTGPTTIPRRSPWGPIQHHVVLAPGIVEVWTAGHGGIHLDPWRQRAMPVALRGPSVWYEEDAEAVRVLIAFSAELCPQRISQDGLASCLQSLAHSDPDAWERHVGRPLRPGESRTKDRRRWEDAHLDALVAVVAWGGPTTVEVQGGWTVAVPVGQVLVGVATVLAIRGCVPRHRRWFLVNRARHDLVSCTTPVGFVADPALDAELHQGVA